MIHIIAISAVIIYLTLGVCTYTYFYEVRDWHHNHFLSGHEDAWFMAMSWPISVPIYVAYIVILKYAKFIYNLLK